MPLPLYRLQEEYKREREHLINQIKGNTGLVFNKYFISWGDNWKIESGNKTGWKMCIRDRWWSGHEQY